MTKNNNVTHFPGFGREQRFKTYFASGTGSVSFTVKKPVHIE
jgi:hypothetical protein